MKKGIWGLAALCLGAAMAFPGITAVAAAAQEEGGRFFTETAPAEATYGTVSAPGYLGEGGRSLYTGDHKPMYRTENVWKSGEGAGAASVSDGYKYVPGETGIVWEWKAAAGGEAHFTGVLYNGIAYETTAMTTYGVADRAAAPQDAASRDGVTVKAEYVAGEGEAKTLWEKAYSADFALFTDGKSVFFKEGDILRITIDGGEDKTADDVYFYIDVAYEQKKVAYDFTGSTPTKDAVGGNDLVVSEKFTDLTTDSEKGLHFAGTGDSSPGTTDTFLYLPDPQSPSFIDDLTDFSISITYTVGDPQRSWSYLFSTTANGSASTGIALRMMWNSAGYYYLNLAIDSAQFPDKAGIDGSFFETGTSNYTNGIYEGRTYTTVINVSSTQKKVEMYTVGVFQATSNTSAQESSIRFAGSATNSSKYIVPKDTWSMNNTGHNLTIGAFHAGGSLGFNGYISDFNITEHFRPLSDSDAAFAVKEGTSAVAPEGPAYAATKEEILAGYATQEVTLNTQGGGTVTAPVTWTDVLFDGTEYYALGTVSADDGLCMTHPITVKAPVKGGKAAAVVYDGQYAGYLTAAEGEGFAVADVETYRKGYALGLYTDAAFEHAYDPAAAEAVQTLYAKLDLITRTVTYYLDEGTNAPENPDSFDIEDEAITLQDPTRAGYHFLGWYLDSGFETQIHEIDPASMQENLSLYALWERDPVTVTLVPNGGTLSDTSEEYAYGATGEAFAVPEYTGYDFLGYYTAETEGEVFTDAEGKMLAGKTLTENITLYARWEKAQVVLTYNAEPGTVSPASKTLEYGTTGATLDIPTRAGYRFLGWYTSSTEGTLFADAEGKMASGVTATDSMTIYARWEKIEEQQPGGEENPGGSTTPGGEEQKPGGEENPGGTTPGGEQQPGGTTETPEESTGCGSVIGWASGIGAGAILIVAALLLCIRKRTNR